MKFFRKIRTSIGRSILAGKVTKIARKSDYINFNNIKTIGIVWDASKPEDFIILSRFYQKMADQNKEVKIFGFFPKQGFPDQYTAIRYLTCLKKKEVNFFYLPVNPEAEKFVKTRFDVLIDINFMKLLPLVYISSLSQARLKVGLTGTKPESSPFDLMISLKNTTNIESYLDQVIYYLYMINSKSEKKAV